MSYKRNRIYGAIVLVFTLAAIQFGVVHSRDSTHAVAATNAAPEVDVATVASRSITEWHSYSGRLEAVDKVEVRPLVPGRIVAVHFKDTAMVKKGDRLFTIDPRPYAAEVDRTAAQVAAAQARLTYGSADASRATRLLAENAISRRDYDGKQSALREADASLKAARAAWEAAKVNLDYTEICAPVAGRVSRAELTVGNVVSTGADAPVLTTVVSISPIYAAFDIDEQTYLRYVVGDGVATLPVDVGLANENGYSRAGMVVSVDNHFDTGSGTVRVRARVQNEDGKLIPGLFARVRVGGGQAEKAILIAESAIATDQDKKYVLVVDKANRVQYRDIILGGVHEGKRVVTSGLKDGERVVVNGGQRVHPDDQVRPVMAATDDVALASAGRQPASH